MLTRIEKAYPKLTSSQKKLAGYILSNQEKAVFLSTSQLASELGISEATVFRFAVKLGYRGIPALKRDMQGLLREKMTQSLKLKKATAGRKAGGDLLEGVFRMDMDNLNTTWSNLKMKDFHRAVDLILAAEQIYTIGLRGSMPLSSYLGLKLKQLSYKVTILGLMADEIYEELLHLDPSCTVIGISFSNYSRMTVSTLRHAREAGSRIIGITDHSASPIYRLADVAFTPKIEGVSFSNSYVAVLSLINGILAEIARRRKEESLRSLNAIEGLLKRHDQFVLE